MDPTIYNNATNIDDDFPAAYTFGLGADHDPVALKYIADKTRGTYSYVNHDTRIIEDAFAVFITGVTTVVATSAQITLQTHNDVTIAAIDSGGYQQQVTDGNKRATIRVHNLYAGDRKSFVVYLKLLKTDKDGKQKLLSVGGQYESLGTSKKQIAGTDVSVLRPLVKPPPSPGAGADPDCNGMVGRTNDDVAKEVARSKLLEVLKDLVNRAIDADKKNNTQNNNNNNNNKKVVGSGILDQALRDAKRSVKADMDDTHKEDWWKDLAKEVDNLKTQAGDFYLLSWLSSQSMQLATTKDTLPTDKDLNPDTAAACFLTQAQQQAVIDANKQKAAAAAGAPKDDGGRWKKLVARAKSRPWLFLPPSVAGALAVAWLLAAMAHAMLEARSSSQAAAALRLGPLQYPMLSESEGNYGAWAIKMEAYLRAQGVWDAVAAKDPREVSPRKDQMALAAIYQAIPEGKLFLLSRQQQKTAKSAWEALRTMHIGDQRLRDAKLQTLRLQFEGLRMKETESVEDFAARLTTVVNKIQAVGESIPEPYVVKKFLRAVPTKYLQVASAIEQFSDLDTMTVQEVLGRLKAHEERLGLLGGAEKENELMTRAEWKARQEAEESRDAFSRLLVSASRSVAQQRIPGARTSSDGGSSASAAHHTPVVSASAAAKILDILLASVIRTKEIKEVKAILVEALRDD
jgi:hypothetical protein